MRRGNNEEYVGIKNSGLKLFGENIKRIVLSVEQTGYSIGCRRGLSKSHSDISGP